MFAVVSSHQLQGKHNPTHRIDAEFGIFVGHLFRRDLKAGLELLPKLLPSRWESELLHLSHEDAFSRFLHLLRMGDGGELRPALKDLFHQWVNINIEASVARHTQAIDTLKAQLARLTS